MHHQTLTAFGVMIALALLVVGCGTPTSPTSAPNTVTLPNTPAAAPTVAPAATSAPTTGAGPTLAVGTPVPTTGASSAPTSQPTQAAGSSPTTRPTTTGGTSSTSATACDRSTFVTDVTIPDRTRVTPGQSFTKTWRLRNSGTCTWGKGYELVFFQGTSMANTTVLPIPATRPGATVDLSVPMIAPTTLGTRTGFWRLRAPNGSFFGSTIWATVDVVAGSTPSAPAYP